MLANMFLGSLNGRSSHTFALADVKPGMKGVGKTCFQGGQPEDFQAEIIGILRGIGPGANAILARLSGGPLEKTGVFEGMSGSPVFIDGKLAGAVAFSFPFAKEAIAGITPIDEMVQATLPPPATAGAPMPTAMGSASGWFTFAGRIARPSAIDVASGFST